MFATGTKVAATATPVADFSTLRTWKEIASPVEPFLGRVAQRLSDQVRAFEPSVALYAEYALTNQGKQLRPALVALSSGLDEGFSEDLVTVGVIIEMVHLATLVHDDVVDVAELRRGRPSLACNWGNEIAVLLGDCLFAHALELAASFDTPEICRAVAGTTNTVCTGEILQNQQRGNFELKRSEYVRMLEMKTGSLFGLSCDLGAAIGGGKESRRANLRGYGMALGTAYQLYDDCVDLFGSEASAGKSLGTDLAHGKLTLPVLVALERASEQDRTQLKKMVSHWDPGVWDSVRQLLDKYEALAESRQTVHEYVRDAQGYLRGMAKTPRQQGLEYLADFLAQQTDGLGVAS